MQQYNIVRFYQNVSKSNEIIIKNLTLKEAQKHCNDIETSSSTCMKKENQNRTLHYGVWFDGYEKV